jgi:protein ImuA
MSDDPLRLARARDASPAGASARDRAARALASLGQQAGAVRGWTTQPDGPADRARSPGLDFLDVAPRRAALHEFHAATEADAAATTGFALAVARTLDRARPLVWARQDFHDVEAGLPYPPGLAAFGLDPAAIIRVRARDAPAALQAGLEAARHPSGGVALIELWGEARAFDLTASRRLALAAKASGVTVLVARGRASSQPSAAETRWLVRAAPSRALAANAPGHPAFVARLLRHRGGLEGREWSLEWNRDAERLEARRVEDGALPGAPARAAPGGAAPLSRAVVSVSPDRPAEDGGGSPAWREAG